MIKTLTKDQAVVFRIGLRWPDEEKARAVEITRYSNHGTPIEKGGWVACITLSSMNPWYVSTDGLWRYKHGDRFESADDAYLAVQRSQSITASVNEHEQV